MLPSSIIRVGREEAEPPDFPEADDHGNKEEQKAHAGLSAIEGTRGLRKMRYAPKAWDTGKRGALRVCYVHFERFHTVLLAIVYLKGEQDDLSAAATTAINKAIDRIGKGLQDRFGEAAG